MRRYGGTVAAAKTAQDFDFGGPMIGSDLLAELPIDSV